MALPVRGGQSVGSALVSGTQEVPGSGPAFGTDAILFVIQNFDSEKFFFSQVNVSHGDC